jgi:hypothetical protein
MLIDTRKHIPPMHKPPRLQESVFLMSFENQWRIQNIYKEIIGLNDIDYFTVNIVSPQDEVKIKWPF